MYKFDGTKFSEKLKAAIKNAGYTQAKFSELTGIPVSTLASYLNEGRMPKAESLYIMAKALNTSMDNLMEYNEPIESQPHEEITPADIINAINILTEAYGYWIIRGAPFIDNNEENVANSLEIMDFKVHSYLESLRTKGDTLIALEGIGEGEAVKKLKAKWANIDDCIFENKHIYSPYVADARGIIGYHRYEQDKDCWVTIEEDSAYEDELPF